ncbi:MAG TPA: hypothetical protein VLF89_04115 [Candidatus Saccharimonadales bacterium]|nr:hypothetical protein [Candidatus Saccharimonadales bacterium]
MEDKVKILHLEDKVKKLQAFKDYVHERLDAMKIPAHPEGEHSKAGCRIGDRLDIVQEKTDKFDKLDKWLSEFYANEEEQEDGLITIGEQAATVFGYL